MLFFQDVIKHGGGRFEYIREPNSLVTYHHAVSLGTDIAPIYIFG